MKDTHFTLDQLVPHVGSALLLDQFLDAGENWVEVEVNHQHPSLYADHQGNVPSWVGIEYMAQTISLYAGLEARRNDRPITPGFLLGTRSYRSTIDYFPPSVAVIIRAELCFRDETNIVMFHCTLTDRDNNLLAEADIKAIQPDDLGHFLKDLQHD